MGMALSIAFEGFVLMALRLLRVAGGLLCLAAPAIAVRHRAVAGVMGGIGLCALVAGTAVIRAGEDVGAF
ncbi:hypothetical protein [Streptomyces lavendofoliae]|uniref:Uncharacterized protein n=1 Tax=Streptomyces lavendofoliae TaxID=67314 RepID=A0A918HY23_9ACTN|nr:hypothetical protein [Streptomyces lavendofoliae]GGU35978.1 hypothetical protein GCM10010274_24140 [Streptomyces lavendofoliae]